MIVETLADIIIDTNQPKEVRDIYSLAMRSSMTELNDEAAKQMIGAVLPKLKNGVNSGFLAVQEECVDILAEVFRNFSQVFLANQNFVNRDEYTKILSGLLKNQHPTLRKKTTVCIGLFAVTLNAR